MVEPGIRVNPRHPTVDYERGEGREQTSLLKLDFPEGFILRYLVAIRNCLWRREKGSIG